MGWKTLTLQVINSPFNQQQVELLNQLLPILTETQQIWLGGYLSASQLVTQSNASGSVAVLEASATQVEVISKEVTILYGSQTGNGQALAEKLTKNLKAEEYQVTSCFYE